MYGSTSSNEHGGAMVNREEIRSAAVNTLYRCIMYKVGLMYIPQEVMWKMASLVASTSLCLSVLTSQVL